MKLHEMHYTPGARHSKKRVGRGIGSGRGKTSTRGENGQKKRGRGKIRPGFEGGQNPLYRRIPKRGFNNFNFETKYAVINLDKIESLGLKVITPEILKEKGIVKKQYDGIKVLGNGTITSPITIKAHKFSKSAIEKINKAKGTIEVLKNTEKIEAKVAKLEVKRTRQAKAKSKV
jgi:large subunit ribosomal protein L15